MHIAWIEAEVKGPQPAMLPSRARDRGVQGPPDERCRRIPSSTATSKSSMTAPELVEVFIVSWHHELGLGASCCAR
jgi:hypothetical protein